MNPNDFSEIFEPFDRLITIEICGKTSRVPENNTLLRGFQFLSMESISFGDFCWNGECSNCRVWIEDDGKEKSALACRTKVVEKMRVVRLSAEIDLNI